MDRREDGELFFGRGADAPPCELAADGTRAPRTSCERASRVRPERSEADEETQEHERDRRLRDAARFVLADECHDDHLQTGEPETADAEHLVACFEVVARPE